MPYIRVRTEEHGVFKLQLALPSRTGTLRSKHEKGLEPLRNSTRQVVEEQTLC